MTEPTTEPGKWLVAEYARTPGDPKWYPGLGLESTVIAIESEAGLLNVERLARALHQLQSGPHRDRNPVAGEGRDACDLDAAKLAREYAALEEPTP